MRKLTCALLLALAAAPLSAADVTVLTAYRIHTMDAAQPQVQAMAFDGSGKVLEVGEAKALLARHPGARRLDVGSATVVPGLIDAHGHMSGLGWAMLRHLIDYARADGIRQIEGLILAENTRMLSMCREFGFDVGHHPEEPGLMLAALNL